jgi:hypothetical protein
MKKSTTYDDILFIVTLFSLILITLLLSLNVAINYQEKTKKSEKKLHLIIRE